MKLYHEMKIVGDRIQHLNIVLQGTVNEREIKANALLSHCKNSAPSTPIDVSTLIEGNTTCTPTKANISSTVVTPSGVSTSVGSTDVAPSPSTPGIDGALAAAVVAAEAAEANMEIEGAFEETAVDGAAGMDDTPQVISEVVAVS